jgi:hypothetical protein
MGGYHSFGAGGYRDTALADVMPIVMDRFERQDFDAPVRGDLHLESPIRMIPAHPHPVISLGSDAENMAAWERLPPLKGANKFVDVKDAAGVRVIAESDRGQPLLVSGEYGQGRVLAMAGDSTWRWWMQGHDAEHRRFWRQSILWLVGREDLQQDQVWIKLAQRRYHPEGRVSFTAGVSSPAGQTIPEAVVRAELTLPDQSRRDLRLTIDDHQWTGMIESLELPGDYAITITAELEGAVIGTARGEFLVYDRDIELASASADHDQLARLAAMTEQFGGRMVAPEQLVSLLEEVRDKPPEMEIEVQTKWQLADTARDAWTMFLVFVAVLTGEWFLRKRWGLV